VHDKAEADEVSGLDNFDPARGSRKPVIDPDAEKAKSGKSKWGSN
jgi:hypothetical protein